MKSEKGLKVLLGNLRFSELLFRLQYSLREDRDVIVASFCSNFLCIVHFQ